MGFPPGPEQPPDMSRRSRRAAEKEDGVCGPGGLVHRPLAELVDGDPRHGDAVGGEDAGLERLFQRERFNILQPGAVIDGHRAAVEGELDRQRLAHAIEQRLGAFPQPEVASHV